MQTFLPYPDFTKSARVLDNKRLGKQRVECLQILKTLSNGPWICSCCRESIKPQDIPRKCQYSTGFCHPIKTPWYNHPAVKMWRNKKHALALYGCHVCFEWRKRGFKDTCVEKICNMMRWTNELEIALRSLSFDELYPKYDYPLWLGNEAFHASHRSNLLRKDPNWYGQFGWTEPNDLPYVWPV